MQIANPKSISSSELYELAAATGKGIQHLYLHWTAGRYHQFFDDYHLNIDEDGKVYQTCDYLTERKSHTYKRNSGAIGITLCCCLDAHWSGTSPDFGSVPPTSAQLCSLAWVVAIICLAIGLEINSSTVMTHGEAAFRDGYGPGSGDPDTRWDLFWVPDASDGRLQQGGVFIRELAKEFAQRLQGRSMPTSTGEQPLLLPLFSE